jgi:hypothetical protein
VCKAINKGSQIHNGGFFFAQYLNCAILKRDIVYRGEFHLFEVMAILKKIGINERIDEMEQDMRQKGDRRGLSFFGKLKYDFGIV